MPETLGTAVLILSVEDGQLKAKLQSSAIVTKQLDAGMINLNATMAVGQKAMQIMGQLYDATAGSVLTLAKQVYGLQLKTGDTAEDASKLVYIMGRLGLSVDDVASALNIAMKKGIDVSMAGLERAATVYNAFGNATDRSRWLLDNFGRAGQNLAPIFAIGAEAMEDLSSQATEVGAVMGEKGVESALQYQNSISELTTVFQALGRMIGEFLMPGLELFVSFLIGGIKTIKELTSGQIKLNQVGGEFVKQSALSWESAKKLTDEQTKLTKAEQTAAEASKAEAAALKAADEAAKKMAEEGLKTLQKGLEGWKQVGQDAATEMDRYLTKGSKPWLKIMGDIDARTGSNIVQQYQYNKLIHDATMAYMNATPAMLKTGKALDDFNASMDAAAKLKGLDPMQELEKHAEEAGVTIDNIYASIPKDVWTTIHLVTVGGGSFLGSHNLNERLEAAKYGGQHGLDTVVPQGFPNDTFPVFASTGERVTIQTPEQQRGAGGRRGPLVGSVYVGNTIDEQVLIRKLAHATGNF